MSQAIMHTAKSVRHLVIHQINAIPEELFDTQPQGFSNTIRWNIGHLLVILDSFLAIGGVPIPSNLPESYSELFGSGTKPSDWKLAPPAKEELLHYLSSQLHLFSELAPELLDAPLKAPVDFGPLHFEQVGEVFNFAFVHETMHLATITCLLKYLQVNA